MEYITGTTEFAIEGASAVTLGKFDGLHRGHQILLSHVKQKQQEGLKALIFTFDFGHTQSLMLNWERKRMLEKQGVDVLLECPFVPGISHLEPEVFVRKILKEQLHAAYLAVGEDFRFGYQRKGNYDLLRQMAEECGYEVEVVPKAQYNGRDISSTYIREELAAGNMQLVEKLLGYPYCVTGRIRHGRAVGRTLGLPTINLVPEPDKLLPPNGVYAAEVLIEGKQYRGVANIGYKPTVGGESQKGVETYLFDVNEDLYEKEATVSFREFERPEQRFDSLEKLKAQIAGDVQWGMEWFSKNALVSLRDLY